MSTPGNSARGVLPSLGEVPKLFLTMMPVPNDPKYGHAAGEMAHPCICGRETNPDECMLVLWRDHRLMFAHPGCLPRELDEGDDYADV